MNLIKHGKQIVNLDMVCDIEFETIPTGNYRIIFGFLNYYRILWHFDNSEEFKDAYELIESHTLYEI